MMLRIFDAFFLQTYVCWILFGTLTIIFDILEETIEKIIESRYIGICPIIDKIIDIGRRLPQIIGDFRDLSAKLSISKMTGELSKIYRYRKKWLIAHPYQRLVGRRQPRKWNWVNTQPGFFFGKKSSTWNPLSAQQNFLQCTASIFTWGEARFCTMYVL